MSENILEPLAKELRQIFARRRRERDGKYSPAKRYTQLNLWLEVARLCKGLNADPETFISAAFDYSTVPGGPYPNMLTGKAMEGWYRQKAAQYIGKVTNEGEDMPAVSESDEYRIRLAECLVLSQQVIGFKGIIDFFEQDIPFFQIPYWVRYVMLKDYPEKQRKFHALAKHQVLSNPALQRSLAEMGYDVSFIYQ